MKTFIISAVSAVAAGLIAGCTTTETGTVSQTDEGTRVYGLSDQPQSAIAGEGSLMPGAYGSRPLPNGQFTGRERTNDQVGQRPTLPQEADARELARSKEGTGMGTGTLGQSGIIPDRPVSTETLMETSAQPVGSGAPPSGTTGAAGSASSTNAVNGAEAKQPAEEPSRPE